uniref:Uncharacterized protein n=1 Tax=Romanomermis culicivorax TaxID=13658 RepID=A0A915JSH7_ROMCU
MLLQVLGHGHRSSTNQTGLQSNQNTNRRMSSDEASTDGSSNSATGGQWRHSRNRNGSWSSSGKSNSDGGGSGFEQMNGSRGWSSASSNDGGWTSIHSGRQQSGRQRAGGSRAASSGNGQFQSFSGSTDSRNQNSGDIQWPGNSGSSGSSSSNQERSQNEHSVHSWSQQGNRARGRSSSHGN